MDKGKRIFCEKLSRDSVYERHQKEVLKMMVVPPGKKNVCLPSGANCARATIATCHPSCGSEEEWLLVP